MEKYTCKSVKWESHNIWGFHGSAYEERGLLGY
jgi:hypothetical protein